MLKNLALQNFAIIENLNLDFGSGLNVFSGETGAGKSIIIEALSFALGERADTSLIKDGANKMSVAAVFSSDILSKDIKEQYKIITDTFTLRRELDAKGKSKAWFNNNIIPIGKLSEIGDSLVDFHGQHEHQNLIKPAAQLALLDKFAGVTRELNTVEILYKRKLEAAAKLNASRMSKEEKQRLLEVYSFQLKEINDLNLKEGEDIELEQALPKLKYAEKLKTMSEDIYSTLYEGEAPAVDALSKALKELEDMCNTDAALMPLAAELKAALTTVETVGEEMGRYKENIDVDTESVDKMLLRDQKIKHLKVKYGPEIKDILAKALWLEEQTDLLENADEKEAELKEELDQAALALAGAAEILHDKRFEAAEKLSKLITAEIKPLGFKEIKFKIALGFDEENIGPKGGTSAEFLFSPNPGQGLKPLKNIASGGEMSRVMLGIKAVLSEGAKVTVFDEIDAGIGGDTGLLVGQKLKKVSAGRQSLCVTHLAQVAVYADKQFNVEKKVVKQNTLVEVNELKGETRVLEIARMLSGNTTKGSAGYKHAAELLERVLGETK